MPSSSSAASRRSTSSEAQGKTIVIVTHALGSIRNLCDTVALLEHGELQRVGTPSEVIDEYLGDVFLDRVPDGAHGERWGSGEGQIERDRNPRRRRADLPVTSGPVMR